jgi:FMN-dependent NADH-azoreductase
MKKILLLHSSPRGERSHTRRLATELVGRLQQSYPDSQLVVRDLAADQGLPHLSGAFIAAMFTPPEARTSDMADTLAFSDTLVDELLSTDIFVFATPMFNLTVSSHLKAWIDHVVRPGRTFWFDEGKYGGLLDGKIAYVVSASGGSYSHGSRVSEDFQIPYLRHILGFMGVTDVRIVRAEGVSADEPTALARARDAMEAIGVPA